jgi:hypothetical protein
MRTTGPESTVPRAVSGAGGTGLGPQKVLRTFWGAPKSCRAGAGGGVGSTEPPKSGGVGFAGAEAGTVEGRA